VNASVTNGIRVVVRCEYLSDQSDARASRYVFAYTIRISNESEAPVQLRNRHWHILHGNGKEEQVHGPGVVGKQPVITPGTGFQYTSGCVLTTPHGTMRGSYEMVREDGTTFLAEIPAFSLAVPHVLN
jgi:ApaG protein